LCVNSAGFAEVMGEVMGQTLAQTGGYWIWHNAFFP